jgi:hypothetical protein
MVYHHAALNPYLFVFIGTTCRMKTVGLACPAYQAAVLGTVEGSSG